MLSCVSWRLSDEALLVGEEARDQLATNPFNTIYDAKRLIGRFFDDSKVNVFMEKHWPFRVVSNKPKYEVRIKASIQKRVLARASQKRSRMGNDWQHD